MATTSASAVWYSWVTDGTTSTATTSNDATWQVWASGTASTISTTSATTNGNTVWYAWNNGQPVRMQTYQPRPETEEEKQARLVREEQARVEAEERRRKEAEALQRAEDLLMLQLSTRQKKDWKKSKSFDVVSESGKRYRINNARGHNVDEYDEQGKKVANHCIVMPHNIPLPDQFVAQMLMLQHHEADFMRIANHQRYTH